MTTIKQKVISTLTMAALVLSLSMVSVFQVAHAKDVLVSRSGGVQYLNKGALICKHHTQLEKMLIAKADNDTETGDWYIKTRRVCVITPLQYRMSEIKDYTDMSSIEVQIGDKILEVWTLGDNFKHQHSVAGMVRHR